MRSEGTRCLPVKEFICQSVATSLILRFAHVSCKVYAWVTGHKKLTQVWGIWCQNTGTRRDSAFGGVCAWSFPLCPEAMHCNMKWSAPFPVHICSFPNLSKCTYTACFPRHQPEAPRKASTVWNPWSRGGTGEMLMSTWKVANSSKMKLERGSDLKGEWVLGGSASYSSLLSR